VVWIGNIVGILIPIYVLSINACNKFEQLFAFCGKSMWGIHVFLTIC
jgi:hypothetical protein